jgi:hypothetical protein
MADNAITEADFRTEDETSETDGDDPDEDETDSEESEDEDGDYEGRKSALVASILKAAKKNNR